MDSIVRNTSWFALGLSVAVILLFGAVMVQSVSTISTNIATDGTLAVTGASTLTGAVTAAAAVQASSTLQVTGAVRNYSTLTQTGAATFTADATFDGGIDAITLTHTNAATSSITVGCVDTFATSTASPIKFMLFASSSLTIDTTSITAGFGGGTSEGLVLWGFGSCA